MRTMLRLIMIMMLLLSTKGWALEPALRPSQLVIVHNLAGHLVEITVMCGQLKHEKKCYQMALKHYEQVSLAKKANCYPITTVLVRTSHANDKIPNPAVRITYPICHLEIKDDESAVCRESYSLT